MILLPKLKIERDELTEVQVIGKMRAWLQQQDQNRTAEIHASDLLDPRRAYWQWASPKELQEKEVGLFVIGKVLHSFILGSVNPEHDEFSSDSGTKHALGIAYSQDWTRDGHPIELKSSRAAYETHPYRLQEDLYIYWEQTCIYAALEGCEQAELWILYMSLKDKTGKTTPAMRCYRVELTSKQLADLKQQVLEIRDALLEARETRNPRDLELCRGWKCGDACAWWNQCQPPGRYPTLDKRKWTM